MYDQREKAQRDYEWALSGARAEGLEQGREQGLEQGKLLGTIQTLQTLLRDKPTPDTELRTTKLPTLMAQLAELQQRLRHRQA